jgi:hypothetical protein
MEMLFASLKTPARSFDLLITETSELAPAGFFPGLLKFAKAIPPNEETPTVGALLLVDTLLFTGRLNFELNAINWPDPVFRGAVNRFALDPGVNVD